MTTAEIIKHLKAMAAARRAMLKMTQRSMGWIDSAEVQALEAAIEIISSASSGKTYTAFDVIRLVQRAVSDEVCAMDANEAAIGYEIERSIIGKLVKEDGCETNV